MNELYTAKVGLGFYYFSFEPRYFLYVASDVHEKNENYPRSEMCLVVTGAIFVRAVIMNAWHVKPEKRF